jgi:stress response protein YsnF
MSSASNSEAGDLTVPLHTEEVTVQKLRVANETVRVSTVVREQEQLVDEELTHERVEVDRVPIGRPVDVAPPIREEGDTTIISVVEEIVVVERRLILKEEVRIRRVFVSERHRETVMVRKQDAVITRTEAGLPAMPDEPDHVGTDPSNTFRNTKDE